jgi:PhzF family phenazine biosynthesis protein
MGLRIVQVDAFASRPFSGNPAAVCVLPQDADEQWMRNVAREMNLSETAFLVPKGDAYALRWFTPAVEVDLCGHATLASAHVLWEDGHLPRNEQARFDTRSGRLTADHTSGSQGDWIEMDFPAKTAAPAEPPRELLPALGLARANFVGRNVFDYLVEADSEETLRALAPDHTALRKLPVRGVIVTARSSSADFDFISRFFAPGAGVDEDPVTGSAHTALGPYWAVVLGKSDLVAYQASPRGGVVRVGVRGDRVLLAGQAITVMTGELKY